MVRGLSITVLLLFMDRVGGVGGANRSAKRLLWVGGASSVAMAAAASALILAAFLAGAGVVFGADVLLTIFSSLGLYTTPMRWLGRGGL